MLDIAINYVEQVKQKFRSTWFKERYKYWTATNYSEEWNPIHGLTINLFQ